MSNEADNEPRMCLDGDWSMSGVAERFPALAAYFAGPADPEASSKEHICPAAAQPEIDLAGVTNFDACGCQLLVLLLRNLRQKGISAQLINISDAFRFKIHSLGFDRELNLSL